MNPIKKYNLLRSIVHKHLIDGPSIALLKLKNPTKDLDFAMSGIAQEVAQCESADSVAELISRYVDVYFDTRIPPIEFAGSAVEIWQEIKHAGV